MAYCLEVHWAAEMAKAGVSEAMIRLSIGIEHIDDLIVDPDQAPAEAWRSR